MMVMFTSFYFPASTFYCIPKVYVVREKERQISKGCLKEQANKRGEESIKKKKKKASDLHKQTMRRLLHMCVHKFKSSLVRKGFTR